MNTRRIIWMFVALLPMIFSCTNEDIDQPDNAADRAANGWIYGIMQDNYLWQDELPSDPRFSDNYYDFFRSLLSDNDGRHYGPYDYYYSYIYRYIPESALLTTRAEPDYYTSSYGFDYIITQSVLYDPLVSEDVDEGDYKMFQKKYATIVYVKSDSAADSAKLSRGDHIYKINGKEIPQTHYTKLLSQLTAGSAETSTVTFTLCDLTQVGTAKGTLVEEGIEVTLPLVTRGEEVRNVTLRSTYIDNSPLYPPITYDVNGVKVGYLIYNEFDRGGASGYYDEKLKEAFQTLKAERATELVLDLRYNPGGSVASCQLLASLIAPSGYTGSVFQKMRRYDGSASDVLFTSQPNSLNLNRVFILASGNSASASEALIHCLRGAGIEVIHIGSRTEGKNVGMNTYTTKELAGTQASNISPYVFEAYPVTFYVEDKDGKGYSTSGLEPDHVFYEEFIVDFQPLGSRQEPMLKMAFDLISPTRSAPAPASASTQDSGIRVDVRLADKVKPARPYLEN